MVLYGRELSVALRYGRMIRRVAEEPEPSRLLEEAAGRAVRGLRARRAQGARRARRATELVGGARATVFELRPGDAAPSDVRARRRSTGLRKWRNAASIDALSGRVVVDDATGALVRCDLTAKFATAGDPKPVRGDAWTCTRC